MNILFVERDRARRRLIKEMLQNAGATLLERGVDESAGDLSTVPVALALVEVGQGDEGARLLARVKGLLRATPSIIALVDAPNQAAECRAGGADEVLVEPVAMTALFEAIGRHLPAGPIGGEQE